MTKNMVAVFYGEIPPQAGEDDRDVIDQVTLVKKALLSLDYKPVTLSLSLDLKQAVGRLKKIKPRFVFNLVESIRGRGEFIYFAPVLLDSLGIPYTGATTQAVMFTSNKVTAKQLFHIYGIPTPPWCRAGEALTRDPGFAPPYIIKKCWEHASLGLDEKSLVFERKELAEIIKGKTAQKTIDDFFVEAYIDGREFNLSLLAGETGAEVLPPAEIQFHRYAPGKARIVDYKAKWEKNSFEYNNTPRTFDFATGDAPLLDRLKALALKCWEDFKLSGYARVDFRVDEKGNPYVLEININPCIAPDGGFIAACSRAGLTHAQVVKRIIGDIGNDIC